MEDFISDEEMKLLEKKSPKSNVPRGTSEDFISDEEMSKLDRKAPSTIDSYTGAPVRQLIGSLQKGKGLLNSLSDAKNAFGSDSTEIPSARDIRKGFGIPDVPLAAGNPFMKVAGLLGGEQDVGDAAVAWGADLTNVIPVAAGAKLAGKGLKAANKALNVSPKAEKALGLLAPVLTEKAVKAAVGGAFGAKLGGLPGMAAGAYVAEKLPDIAPKLKTATKKLSGLLDRGEIVKGPFKNFPAAPGTALIRRAEKIPKEELAAAILRAKLAAERLSDDE